MSNQAIAQIGPAAIHYSKIGRRMREKRGNVLHQIDDCIPGSKKNEQFFTENGAVSCFANTAQTPSSVGRGYTGRTSRISCCFNFLCAVVTVITGFTPTFSMLGAFPLQLKGFPKQASQAPE
jgi:hypothetical protein